MNTASLVLGAVFVNNLVLNQLLGLCPLFEAGASKRSAFRLGLAMCLALALTAPASWALLHHLLEPLGLQSLQTLAYVLLIAGIVRAADLASKKLPPATGGRFAGGYLSLLAANCAVLGACLLAAPAASLMESAVAGLAAGCGYLLVSVVLAEIRSRLDVEEVPGPMRGLPIALVSAALMALAFLTFDRTLLEGLLGKK